MCRQKQPRGDMRLQWVRRSGELLHSKGAEFVVTGVMPAESPGLSGIAGYNYNEGIYVEEAGVQKVLYLELRKPIDYSRGQRGGDLCQLQLFACKSVAEAMQLALVSRGAVGQNFEPRRGLGGFVIRGSRPFKADPTGYVWQESNAGALIFYHVTAQGEHLTFKQWKQDGPVFMEGDDGEWHQVRDASNKWQHEDVADWGEDMQQLHSC